MTISFIRENQVPNIKKTLRFLVEEVWSAGGDGDATWISKYYKIHNLIPILEEMNKEEWKEWWKISMTIGHQNFGSYILLEHDQESLIITNEDDYPVPDWSQCTLRS
jgi:hypothetical protein